MLTLFPRYTRLLPHLLAGGCAFTVAWFVSGTSLRTTGVQFVSPLLLIIAVHVVWMVCAGGIAGSVAMSALRRSCGTAFLTIGVLLLGSIFAPQPALADAGEVIAIVATVVVCALMIGIVVGVVALVMMAFVRVLRAVFGRGKSGDGPQSRLFDVGTLTVVGAVLMTASLEGTPYGYAFDGQDRASTSRLIAAPADRVWETMQTATSPAFPLPAALALFPQPTDVVVDEGTVLGANRVVQFTGREGAGRLHLRVTEVLPDQAVFTVVSDTTPYRGWVRYTHLTYTVTPQENDTLLTVTFDFERRLAPRWFFGPVMRGASYLAADVLARDVAARAERDG